MNNIFDLLLDANPKEKIELFLDEFRNRKRRMRDAKIIDRWQPLNEQVVAEFSKRDKKFSAPMEITDFPYILTIVEDNAVAGECVTWDLTTALREYQFMCSDYSIEQVFYSTNFYEVLQRIEELKAKSESGDIAPKYDPDVVYSEPPLL